jgi:hypothetical protein
MDLDKILNIKGEPNIWVKIYPFSKINKNKLNILTNRIPEEYINKIKSMNPSSIQEIKINKFRYRNLEKIVEDNNITYNKYEQLNILNQEPLIYLDKISKIKEVNFPIINDYHYETSEKVTRYIIDNININISKDNIEIYYNSEFNINKKLLSKLMVE